MRIATAKRHDFSIHRFAKNQSQPINHSIYKSFCVSLFSFLLIFLFQTMDQQKGYYPPPPQQQQYYAPPPNQSGQYYQQPYYQPQPQPQTVYVQQQPQKDDNSMCLGW